MSTITSQVVDIDTLPVITALRLILGFSAVIGNAFIIFLFVIVPRLRSNAYNCLIGFLSVSNFLAGFGLIIRGVFTAISSANGVLLYDKSTCYGVNALIGIGKTASEIVILGISIERLRAVYNPVAFMNNRQDFYLASVATIAVVTCVLLTYGKQVGIDHSVQITVCTAGMATGPYTFYVTTYYTGVFLILLTAVYITSLILLVKIKSENKVPGGVSTLKSQSKMFMAFFFIMLNYMVFYGVPFFFSLLTLIFKFPAEIRSAITLFAGLSAGANAALDCIIYITKHDEIKRNTVKTLLDCCPSIKNAILNNTVTLTTNPSKISTVKQLPVVS